MGDYPRPLTLVGTKLGAPHRELAFSEPEALELIRESVASDSWRVDHVLDARGKIALTQAATTAVKAETLAVVERAKRGIFGELPGTTD